MQVCNHFIDNMGALHGKQSVLKGVIKNSEQISVSISSFHFYSSYFKICLFSFTYKSSK